MSSTPALPGWARRTLCLTLVFLLAKLSLLLLRAGDGLAGPLASGWTGIAFSYQDLWIATGWGLLDFGVSRATHDGARWSRIAWTLYAIIAGWVAFNVPAAGIFGTPLTWPILAATGAALSDSIAVYLTARNLAPLAAIGVAAALLPIAARRAQAPRHLTVWVGAIAAALTIALGPIAVARVECLGLHRNALWALAITAARQDRGASGEAAFPVEPITAEGPARDLQALRGSARGRNIIWVVLESTAAQYLAPYGAARDPMPRLTALAGRGVTFDSAYAVYPESIKGLFSMLCAAAPAAHTSADRYTAKTAACAPVAEQLRSAGYRTALFHSGRFVYLGMRGVVEARGFDTLVDAGDVGGRFASSFGVDEPSTVARILGWIDTQPKDKPFFLMYLPIAGHHPYNAPGEGPRPFGAATELDAYASDLYRGDLALGALIDGLASRGLDHETAWLVNGDHGEAFQQHPGNFAHTLFLYEENVHVPLIVVAPGTTPPARAPQIGSAIDLAPTLLDLAGLSRPPAWQGRSLLDAQPGVARFYTDQAVWQVGLRTGPWKLIHEMESGRSRLFNLDRDPAETRDVSAAEPARTSRYRNHLRGWAARERARVLGHR